MNSIHERTVDFSSSRLFTEAQKDSLNASLVWLFDAARQSGRINAAMLDGLRADDLALEWLQHHKPASNELAGTIVDDLQLKANYCH